MDDMRIEQLARDIEDLKRAVKRNAPVLHDIFDMKGWDIFSLLAGIAISLFALPAHILVAVYGSFAGIPAPWRAALWVVLAVTAVGSGIAKMIMFARSASPGANLARIRDVIGTFFCAGNAKHVNIPLLALLVVPCALAIRSGHPWYALSGIAIMMGLWSNLIVFQTGVRTYLALGYWGILSGTLSLFFIERAPYLWIFAVYGGMFLAFAAAIRIASELKARSNRGNDLPEGAE